MPLEWLRARKALFAILSKINKPPRSGAGTRQLRRCAPGHRLVSNGPLLRKRTGMAEDSGRVRSGWVLAGGEFMCSSR